MKRTVTTLLLALALFAAPTIATVSVEVVELDTAAEAHTDGSCSLSSGNHSHWFLYNRLSHTFDKRVGVTSVTWLYYHRHSFSYTPWQNHTVKTLCRRTSGFAGDEWEVLDVVVEYDDDDHTH